MKDKMIDSLKCIGSEWHKGDMHRFYIDLEKANAMYKDNNAEMEHGALPINRRDKTAGKVWFDLTADEINLVAQNVSAAKDLICGIMELVNLLTKEIEEEQDTNRTWYAVMRDLNDDDFGTGSFDLAEATRQVKQMRADGDTEAYIAVISNGICPVCVDEIHDFDV